ncbi:cytochrome P450 [Phanerochaete sordida]|uniref:Cytochrome P450 n=1 Tax=Phanerochaete sordida TaxID=48140 RepID=A0A9P3LFJ1_9APHY|nr:cytochrome P450 [Phanerochaete sordida]
MDISWTEWFLVPLCAFILLVKLVKDAKAASVPTVGPSAPILSYWGALKFITHTRDVLEAGHAKYPGRTFRIATWRRWHYVLPTPAHIDELSRAPEDQLSFMAAANDAFELERMLPTAATENLYHLPIIRTTLTRNLARLQGAMHEEICEAFARCVPVSDEWRAVPALDAMTRIVAQVSARIMVGAPLCHDPELLDMLTNFTTDVATSGLILSMVPGPLKPIVKRAVSNVDANIYRTARVVGPAIEQRRTMMEKYGQAWPERPNDVLQWLMEAAEGEERETRALATRLLLVGFAAIHTTSMKLTYALYRLAANPQYVAPLREEVEACIARDGWSKAALQKMVKVDSFLREVQRVDGLSYLLLVRKAMTDYTFADGTFIPQGSYVSTSSVATHYDDAYYTDATTFAPWRFVGTGGAARSQMIDTGLDYLPFGHGRHVCPGRFFAASELKTILAHLVVTYDVRMESAGGIPPSISIFHATVPSRIAKVVFRKREVEE